jgi:transglutaminase-like putative cysteine protease
MSDRFKVHHTTMYRYSNPVGFGPHRMMLRPRDSHDMRLVSTKLVIQPEPCHVQWSFDVFGNSVATAHFGDTLASELTFESEIELIHYQMPNFTPHIASDAITYPFSYQSDDLPDLQSTMARHRPDPDGVVSKWAARFVTSKKPMLTFDLLEALMESARAQITYRSRAMKGTQDPATTLQLGTGTCRDYALLMMEAVRSLGFAARFVSGYIFKNFRSQNVGSGATHAWVQVFVPGAGWIEFDPTNGIVGNKDLIRVAVTRDPVQASPLSGTFRGQGSRFLGMDVSVQVTQTDCNLVAT